MKRFVAAFLVWSLLSQPAQAQTSKVPFKHITTEEGLSQSNVTCILQDQQGFMWFGTQDGLNKYDGYSFTVYQSDPLQPNSLSDNFVVSLFEDSRGHLWVGTDDGGLCRFDKQTGGFTRFNSSQTDARSLSSNHVIAITEDHQGNLWIATENGLNQFNPTRGTFIRYQHQVNDPGSLSNNLLQDVVVDRQGQLWVATFGGGLDRFDPVTGRFHHYKNRLADKTSISHNQIKKLLEDSQGRLWVATRGGGLNLLNRDQKSFTHFRHNSAVASSVADDDVNTLAEDRHGNLWIGTENEGISVLDKSRTSFSQYPYQENDPDGLNNGSIYALCQDRSGNMWIGTYSGGINLFDHQSAKFTRYQKELNQTNSLTNPNVMAVLEDHQGNLWIGTDGGGVNVLLKSSKRYVHYQHSPADPRSVGSNFIMSLYQDSDGDIWIGSYKGGLSLWRKKSGDFINFTQRDDAKGLIHESVTTIVEGQKGTIWLGYMGGGLSCYTKKNGIFAHYRPDPTHSGHLTQGYVSTLCYDHNHNLWIGTEGDGLNVLNTRNGTFRSYRHNRAVPGSLNHNLVISLYEDAQHQVWVGTYGGLNRFEPQTQSFVSYTEKQGLANKVIQSMRSDARGNLWISTNKGLSVLNSKTKLFRNFGAEDGLQKGAFNRMSVFKGHLGNLFFGGINGLTSFYPDRMRDNSFIPPVVITKLRVFNKPVLLRSNQITLDYDQSTLSFEFAALNYSIPKKNQYVHKLEGFDQDWTPKSYTRAATYTNLGPGTYTFRVNASNNDGIWNKRGTTFRIIIHPPFWQLWWFKSLVTLLLVGSLYLVYRLRVKHLQAQQATLQDQVRLRTSQVLQQKKELQDQALHMQLLQAKVEQQAAQQQLQESEQRFREIAENVDEVFWIHSADPFELIYINPACERVWNTTFEQLRTEPLAFMENVLPEDRPTVLSFMEQYKAGVEGEIYYRLQPTGEPLRWLLVRSFIIRNDAGEALRHIGIASDVTSQKEKEFVLQQSLLREQELNHLKSQFVSTASHEFRTPLTTIQSSAELIKMYLDIPRASSRASIEKHLGVIEKQINQFGVLLSDVLTIGQIEAGKVTFAPDFVDAIDLCEGLVHTHFSRRPDGRSVQLLIDGTPRQVYLDARLMSHVLTNLLSNAFKFSINTPPILRLFFKTNCLVLQVIDRGVGIPASEQSSLFQAFFRASNTAGIQGTGLGLVIARQFVNCHGGQLDVESQENRGTTFTVTLPTEFPEQVFMGLIE
ncbi:two-component regulator propeller domain-containing protein [Spirosoma radiotolerans]|uniref:two-component regulator propeller domain-containing protein n=1 Tax=Spirosoma radiotolerans TaxID=1379870 RepID=UPI000695B9AE|nr:two-component regulator propeller domain-containing protein [Spirosoma radiotolerans]